MAANRNEADERIEYLERLGYREGVYSTNWYEGGGGETTFEGYELEAKSIEPRERGGEQDAYQIYLRRVDGEDESARPLQIDVTHLSDSDFVQLVRKLPVWIP